MPGSILSFARRNLLGLVAIAFVAAPSSFALAASSTSSASTAAKTTRICIIKKTGMLRYVKSPGHCRAGERSFFVSRRGVQGLRGVRGADGTRGPVGADGATGATGAVGAPGGNGVDGTNGANGLSGSDGAPGLDGTNGTNGTNGTVGATGPQGDPGPAGAQGPAGSGSALDFAEFFARMPADNVATVTPGNAISFPQNGPTRGAIVRINPSEFVLTNAGVYKIEFAASITEAAQLQLTVNGTSVSYAVFGRATGTSMITGGALITATPGDIVAVINASAGPVTLTPLAGGANAVTAYMIVQQLS
jgi:BclA C-terminal domain/Collagen triple helix repeat (20 copies)